LQRTLSSSQTFFIKAVFPVLWVGGFAVGTLSMFLLPGSNGPGEPPPGMKWIFLLLTILGTAFLYWTSIRLKRVRMDDQALYVSNYLEEIRIPLQDVREVTENRWINIHPVTIELLGDTAFGRRVVFMPKVRLFALWSHHPVVGEISEAAAKARAGLRIIRLQEAR
jgi:hypothetical protein